MRNTSWPFPTHNAALWPGKDPSLIFPDIVYDFGIYKILWWDILNKDIKEETHYTKIKFGTTRIMQRNQRSDWMRDWWTDYGMNRIGIDHVYHESYVRMGCDICFEHNILDCFHSPYEIVKDMFSLPDRYSLRDNEVLKEYMNRHHQWLILTKIKHQIILNKPMIVRRIFTKAWDENVYKKFQFPEITVF